MGNDRVIDSDSVGDRDSVGASARARTCLPSWYRGVACLLPFLEDVDVARGSLDCNRSSLSSSMV
jgi:hypothetical protein